MKLNWSRTGRRTIEWRGLGFRVSICPESSGPKDADYVWAWVIRREQKDAGDPKESWTGRGVDLLTAAAIVEDEMDRLVAKAAARGTEESPPVYRTRADAEIAGVLTFL